MELKVVLGDTQQSQARLPVNPTLPQAPVDPTVRVNVYDLVVNGKRLNRLNSIALKVGVGGALHTGLVVFGREISYREGFGICLSVPKVCKFGEWRELLDFGVTDKTEDEFQERLMTLTQANSNWKPADYDILNHNCHDFTNLLLNFLTGKQLPSYINKLGKFLWHAPQLVPYLHTTTGAEDQLPIALELQTSGQQAGGELKDGQAIGSTANAAIDTSQLKLYWDMIPANEFEDRKIPSLPSAVLNVKSPRDATISSPRETTTTISLAGRNPSQLVSPGRSSGSGPDSARAPAPTSHHVNSTHAQQSHAHITNVANFSSSSPNLQVNVQQHPAQQQHAPQQEERNPAGRQQSYASLSVNAHNGIAEKSNNVTPPFVNNMASLTKYFEAELFSELEESLIHELDRAEEAQQLLVIDGKFTNELYANFVPEEKKHFTEFLLQLQRDELAFTCDSTRSETLARSMTIDLGSGTGPFRPNANLRMSSKPDIRNLFPPIPTNQTQSSSPPQPATTTLASTTTPPTNRLSQSLPPQQPIPPIPQQTAPLVVPVVLPTPVTQPIPKPALLAPHIKAHTSYEESDDDASLSDDSSFMLSKKLQAMDRDAVGFDSSSLPGDGTTSSSYSAQPVGIRYLADKFGQQEKASLHASTTTLPAFQLYWDESAHANKSSPTSQDSNPHSNALLRNSSRDRESTGFQLALPTEKQQQQQPSTALTTSSPRVGARLEAPNNAALNTSQRASPRIGSGRTDNASAIVSPRQGRSGSNATPLAQSGGPPSSPLPPIPVGSSPSKSNDSGGVFSLDLDDVTSGVGAKPSPKREIRTRAPLDLNELVSQPSFSDLLVQQGWEEMELMKKRQSLAAEQAALINQQQRLFTESLARHESSSETSVEDPRNASILRLNRTTGANPEEASSMGEEEELRMLQSLNRHSALMKSRSNPRPSSIHVTSFNPALNREVAPTTTSGGKDLSLESPGRGSDTMTDNSNSPNSGPSVVPMSGSPNSNKATPTKQLSQSTTPTKRSTMPRNERSGSHNTKSRGGVSFRTPSGEKIGASHGERSAGERAMQHDAPMSGGGVGEGGARESSDRIDSALLQERLRNLLLSSEGTTMSGVEATDGEETNAHPEEDDGKFAKLRRSIKKRAQSVSKGSDSKTGAAKIKPDIRASLETNGEPIASTATFSNNDNSPTNPPPLQLLSTVAESANGERPGSHGYLSRNSAYTPPSGATQTSNATPMSKDFANAGNSSTPVSPRKAHLSPRSYLAAGSRLSTKDREVKERLRYERELESKEKERALGGNNSNAGLNIPNLPLDLGRGIRDLFARPQSEKVTVDVLPGDEHFPMSNPGSPFVSPRVKERAALKADTFNSPPHSPRNSMGSPRTRGRQQLLASAGHSSRLSRATAPSVLTSSTGNLRTSSSKHGYGHIAYHQDQAYQPSPSLHEQQELQNQQQLQHLSLLAELPPLPSSPSAECTTQATSTTRTAIPGDLVGSNGDESKKNNPPQEALNKFQSQLQNYLFELGQEQPSAEQARPVQSDQQPQPASDSTFYHSAIPPNMTLSQLRRQSANNPYFLNRTTLVKPPLLRNSQKDPRTLSGSGAIARDSQTEQDVSPRAADTLHEMTEEGERERLRQSDGDSLHGLAYARFAQTSPVYMYKRADKPLNVRSNITILNVNDEDTESAEGSELPGERGNRVGNVDVQTIDADQ